MQRTYIKDLSGHKTKEVVIKGWVDVARNQGKMAFFDFRDVTGKVQGVVFGKPDVLEVAKELRPEWVVAITGIVNERPEKMVKEGVLNGDIELEITGIEVLNKAETPIFELDKDTREVNEEIRLKYRYLDLRTDRMKNNLIMRDKIITFFRNHMHENGFVEIETPMLMKDTPEGSREYVVPSRKELGTFYALPQSPQQFKQLCMVAGLDRYFQVARCMRDEDLRGDRQPEFTQLDFEMSFVEQEDVLQYTEDMFIKLVKELYPEKTFTEVPFPRMTYAEAMEQYGSDKPDIRKDKENPNELGFLWILDFPMYEETEEVGLQAMHHPFCSVHPDDKEKFMKGEDIFSIRANAYDLVLNGYELSSGSIRIHKEEEQKQVFNLLGIDEETQRKKFGHILDAFTFGAPPHGGFAPGIDRIVMLLQNEPNIREVIAFPKTREAKDPLMNSPAQLSEKQLDELGLKVKK